MKLDYLTALALGRAFEASLVAASVDVATAGRSTTVPSGRVTLLFTQGMSTTVPTSSFTV